MDIINIYNNININVSMVFMVFDHQSVQELPLYSYLLQIIVV